MVDLVDKTGFAISWFVGKIIVVVENYKVLVGHYFVEFVPGFGIFGFIGFNFRFDVVDLVRLVEL